MHVPVPKWLKVLNHCCPDMTCPEVAMYRVGHVPKRLCPETAMSRNGYVSKWLCPETAMSRNGHDPKWLCPEVAMSRNGYVPKCPTFGRYGPLNFGIFSYHPGTPLTYVMSKECLDDAKYAFIVLSIAGLHF